MLAALTLAMVFVIKHTQVRHQRATQRKLDEILLAVPVTGNALLTLEHASDDELHATAASVGPSARPRSAMIQSLVQVAEPMAGSRAGGRS